MPAAEKIPAAKKRRLRREKAAKARAEQEAAAAARQAAGIEPQESSGFKRQKRERKDEKPAAAEEQAETTTEFKERDEVEDWITGGQAAEDNKAARKARKAKAKAEQASKQPEGAPEADRQAVQENHVFVGGIPFSATEADIRGFFEGHGCTGIDEIRIPKKDENGYAAGYCHVSFDAPEQAAKAIALSGETLGERWLQIKPALAESKYNDRGGRSSTVRTVQPAGCKTVFVRNLSFDCSDSKLSAHFERAGLTPIDVRVPNDFHTGRSKGFAYVELADMEDAASAMSKLEGTKLLGRSMHLDYEDRKQFHAGYVRPDRDRE